MDKFGHSTRTQKLLDRLRVGDPAAQAELFRHANARLRILTRRMFHRRADLRALDQTDDVLQKAALRLHKALAQIHPPTVQAFFCLAARHIRWVLADLARELAGQRVHYPGELAEGSPPVPARLLDQREEPTTLAEWTEFHQQVEGLSEPEREIVGLLWYEGLTQEEAARVLEVSLRTVKRRWLAARLLLGQKLGGVPPGSG